MLDVSEGNTFMNRIQKTLATIAVMLAAVIGSCSNDRGTGEKQDSDRSTTTRGEHDRDRGGNEEGEESGTELALNESYDKVRNGVRLILAYDAKSNSFIGTVENTTNKTLERVRVEVHLSNGIELGPTTPADLTPGEKKYVRLTPKSKGFDGWTAHPEVGNEEEGHGKEQGEERGEHERREGRGEHGSGEGRGEHR